MFDGVSVPDASSELYMVGYVRFVCIREYARADCSFLISRTMPRVSSIISRSGRDGFAGRFARTSETSLPSVASNEGQNAVKACSSFVSDRAFFSSSLLREPTSLHVSALSASVA